MDSKFSVGDIVKFIGNEEALLSGLPKEEVIEIREFLRRNNIIVSNANVFGRVEVHIKGNPEHFFYVTESDLIKVKT